MPVRAEFIQDVLALRMVGRYEPVDIRAAFRMALQQHASATVRGLLFDVRDSDVLHARPADEIRTMAQFLSAHAQQFGRRLALVASTDVDYGLMRMGSVYVAEEGVMTAVFRDERDAQDWLHQPSRP
jgi:hypothetical protein